MNLTFRRVACAALPASAQQRQPPRRRQQEQGECRPTDDRGLARISYGGGHTGELEGMEGIGNPLGPFFSAFFLPPGDGAGGSYARPEARNGVTALPRSRR